MSTGNETCPAELPNWCAQRHWGIFWILIVASVAMVAARVLALISVGDPDGLPFFSANDRSRWITVRALVDHGTFEIDKVLASDNGRQWDTIDKVRQVGRDGQFHFYSSKPPLLSIVVAGGYGLLKALFGWQIETDTSLVVATLLLLTNVLLWAIFLWFVARMINSVPVRDWARYFVLGCAGFATFLGSFTVTLNNHLPAAVWVMISLYLVSEIVRRNNLAWRYFFGAGFFSAAAVANELPALAFCGMAGLVCGWLSIRQTLLGFVPAVGIVLTCVLGCNWWAWGQWRPAYNQRTDGQVLATVSGQFDDMLDRGEIPNEIRTSIPFAGKFVEPFVEKGKWPGTPLHQKRWVIRDRDHRSVSQLAVVSFRDVTVSTEAAELSTYDIRAWGNWYDYPGSYWLTDFPRKSAIDEGQTSVQLYAFHLLFGHHGVFSLSPIWILSFAGMFALIGGARMGGRFQMRWLGFLALIVTVVVFSFYLSRPVMDRNYGGYCCTARWLLWLAPIWLMTMLPVVDWLGRNRWGQWICFVLLFTSAASAMVHSNNPWTLPWLYRLWPLTGLPL
jgi:hypothetical protein